MIERAPKPEPDSWKPRSPELELEPWSWKEELRSRSCVILTTAPQPWSKLMITIFSHSRKLLSNLKKTRPRAGKYKDKGILLQRRKALNSVFDRSLISVSMHSIVFRSSSRFLTKSRFLKLRSRLHRWSLLIKYDDTMLLRPCWCSDSVCIIQ